MKLWGGGFRGQTDPAAWKLNASIGFDRRLALQDVRGSLAWAKALGKAGVLNPEEVEQIVSGLQQVRDEFETESFAYKESDEDIHTAVERRLAEISGPVAGKLHTGRSRNDQVATDFRLWQLDHTPLLKSALGGLQSALLGRAESDFGVILPGYTHLQRAQPILLSHWWLSHFWPLQRDQERFDGFITRTASLPLGSAALAGTPYPVDRTELAAELGFSQPSYNSLDAVSDRDFVAEFLFCTALTGTHLSRLAEAVILFSSAEFGFFELSDSFATGSSLIPQKKNPDVFELARGKAGTLLGYLTGLMATLKGLPSTYDKDLQEDKVPVFNAFDNLTALLPVLTNAVYTLEIHPQRMIASIDASMMATDLADYLVMKGVPFRQAHSLAGNAAGLAAQSGKALDELSLDEFQSVSKDFGEDVYQVFDPKRCVSLRNGMGGTAPEAVREQLKLARQAIQAYG